MHHDSFPFRTSSFFLFLSILLGCTPDVTVDTARPRVVYFRPTDEAVVREELVFVSDDDCEIGYVRHTLAGRPAKDAKGALVYFHGIESHAGWFDHVANLLVRGGYDVFCMDRRGSGINRENRGFPSGHIDSFGLLFDDIQAFVAQRKREYERIDLVGLSWGGKLALAFALHRPQDVGALVLITPGIRSQVDLKFREKIQVLLAKPTHPIPVPIEPEMFTDTPEFLALIKADPLRLRYATGRFFYESLRLDRYIDKHIARNRIPILLILAGQDPIIRNDAVRKVIAKGKQPTDIREYGDQKHSVQFDAPERLARDIMNWLSDRK